MPATIWSTNYLSAVDLFCDLTHDELAELEEELITFRCRRGEILYQPGDRGEVLFVLKQGRVELYRPSPTGRKEVIASPGAGAIFGQMAALGQGMHGRVAEAMDDSLLYVLSRADVERLLRDRPPVAFRLLDVMGQRLALLDAELAATE